MRRLFRILALFIGAVVTGLLLASLLLQQACPDCSGTTRYLQEFPSQCRDEQAVLDCRRCNDRGRVSLFNGHVGRRPDPLMADLMRFSNRGSWRIVHKDLVARLQASGVTTAKGEDWSLRIGYYGRARFVHQEGTSYILLLTEAGPTTLALLFDARGTLLDALHLTVPGGASLPTQQFVVPVTPGGPCVRVRLLTWRNRPVDEIEIDHAGKLLKGDPGEKQEKLGLLEWSLYLREGKLRLSGGVSGISIVD